MTENTEGKKMRKKEKIEAPFLEPKINNKSNSEDIFDWDFILDREWLRTKK
ncbi:unnamed protein product [marine sediment metagenome]|uniref:Uncharacterized protein n=1 Tax=marine sediment metagenome TaxID=412755 RepID=X1VSC5_9ZZZZ